MDKDVEILRKWICRSNDREEEKHKYLYYTRTILNEYGKADTYVYDRKNEINAILYVYINIWFSGYKFYSSLHNYSNHNLACILWRHDQSDEVI